MSKKAKKSKAKKHHGGSKTKHCSVAKCGKAGVNKRTHKRGGHK